MTTRQTVRKILITLLTAAIYVWLSYQIGAGKIDTTPEILQVLIQVGVCILLLPLLSVEWQDISMSTAVRIGAVLLLANLLFWGWPLLQDRTGGAVVSDSEAVRLLLKLLGIVALHVCLISFFVIKLRVFRMRHHYTPGMLYFTGVGVLSVFLAAAFALLVGGSYGSISLSCDNTFEKLEEATRSVFPGLSGAKVNQRFSSFQDATFGDLLDWRGTGGDAQLPTGSVALSTTGTTGTGSLWATVREDMSDYYQQFIQTAINQKAAVDQEICNSVLGEIEKVSQTSTFRISLIVLLFVLLGPIITLVMYALLTGGTMLLFLLQLIGVYKREEYETTGETLR